MHGMRPFGALLPKEEALRVLLDAAAPVERTERLPLPDARGRVAAHRVEAAVAVPPYDRATMDGYAVRSRDGSDLAVQGDVYAGARAPPPLAPGHALRIATGAPIPPGADAVVRVEDTREEIGRVHLAAAPRPGQFIDPRGSDLPQGAPVVEAGQVLTPARLGLLASVGLTHAEVWARPRVALFTSGDEVVQPGQSADPWRIFDANGASLRALLENAGAEVRAAPPVPDEMDAIRVALRDAAATNHLVLLTGGASVGAKDLVAQALAQEGEVLFHGVRVKPGKPLLAGRVRRALVIGLPGNPTSALSNACLFVAPTVRMMARLPHVASQGRAARLASRIEGSADRYLFLPVRLEDDRAIPTFKGSGALTSMATSDGWIGVAEGETLPAGSLVTVHPW